ncbi:MAG TPA: autotransporter domain-containing protein [Alphaproteobacteria bacterium]|nr:autotransporter domain-containing protein [Alphaproteobacteria bacterium]
MNFLRFVSRPGRSLNSLMTMMAMVAGLSLSTGQVMAAACANNTSPGADCDTLNVTANTGTVTIGSGITVTGSWAVRVQSISLTTLNNAGTISGSDRGIHSNSGGGIGTVNNTGSIEAGNRAFENAFNSTIGTINNSGTIEAATIINNVFSAHVGTFDNAGTVTAGSNAFLNYSSSIDLISNTGTITAGQYVLSNDSDSSVTTIRNSGTISGGTYSVYNNGYVGSISNTGSFGAIYNSNSGRMGSIYNTGNISKLENGQGGANPLAYSGVLPDVYNIIITSPTVYGQLSATSVTSKTAFGISADSTVKVNTYTAVLSGLTSGNLVSTTGIYGDYNWTLNETGMGTSVWNLVLTCRAGHTCVGGASLDILQSVLNQGGAGTGAANVLNLLVSGSPSGDMGAVSTAFSALSGDAAVADALNQTLPTLAGGATTASLQALNTTSQIVQARQGGLTGLSTGDRMLTDQALWVKPFGTWSDQGAKNGITGYSATTAGLIGGVDGEFAEAWRLGGALSYAHTDVNGDDGRNNVNVDSYQVMGYGSYKVDADTEANMQLGVGINRNDSSRRIVFGGLDRTAGADYNSYSLNVGGGLGRIYNLGQATRVVPSVRMDYTLMRAESYTETGAGGLSLNVKAQTVDQLIPAVQAKLDHDMGDGFNLGLNAGAGYDVLNGRNSVTSSYVGGGAAFVTQGLQSSPWVVRSGLGVNYKPDDIYEVSARYDREDRGGDFDAQTVSVKVRMRF